MVVDGGKGTVLEMCWDWKKQVLCAKVLFLWMIAGDG